MTSTLSKFEMKTQTMVKIGLFGKSGCGLSATGNSILGKQVFKSKYNCCQPTTKKVSSGCKKYKNFQIKVVDGQTFSDHKLINNTEMTFKNKNGKHHRRVQNFDIILFVRKFGTRFSKEEEKILENLENTYGRKVYDKMIIVMTGGDNFLHFIQKEEGFTNVKEWCSLQEGRFQKLYQDCGRRAVLLDNSDKTGNKRKQMRKIVKLIVKLKINHGSSQVHFSGLTESTKAELKSNFYLTGKESEASVSKSSKWSSMSKLGMLCLLLMIESCNSTPIFRLRCHPGTYLHTTRNNNYICLPCPDGTFMPYSLHTHKTCHNCTQIRDHNLEVIKTECSETHDTEILCIPGYYRWRARNTREQDRCEKCSECDKNEHPTRACQDHHDTVCCGSTNYDSVLNKDGVYECKKKPILCDHGQFLNPETEECTPCPPGTFMSEIQHDKTTCRPCKTVSDLGEHEIILQACTSTQQANIGCKDGYFRNSSGNLWDEVKCLPCQNCEYQGRECDMYHDTICCDYPDMIVVNTSSGYQCRHRSSTTTSSHTGDHSTTTSSTDTDTFTEEFKQIECGYNTYFSPASSICLSCERGTYMDKIRHTEPVCKNCSQIHGSYVPKNCPVLTEDLGMNETYKDVIISVIVILLLIIVGVGVRRCCVYCIKKKKRLRQNKPLRSAAQNKPLRNSGKNMKLRFRENSNRLLSKLSNFKRVNENDDIRNKRRKYKQTTKWTLHSEMLKKTSSNNIQNIPLEQMEGLMCSNAPGSEFDTSSPRVQEIESVMLKAEAGAFNLEKLKETSLKSI